MNTNKLGLLSLCVDAVSKEDLQQTLSLLHSLYKKDHLPKYGTTINAYFYSHLHGWNLNCDTNKELLKILRNADFVGLDSPALYKVGKFIGCSDLKIISGEEVLLAACAFLDDNNLSLYVLGGKEETNQSLLAYLRTFFPKIRVVGHATPLIATKGERLEESQERDHYIIEAINQAKPDILLLQLGHPKQEIWFSRVKSMLQVPLTIGIGGAIERFLARIPGFKEEEATSVKLIKPIAKFFKNIPNYLKYAAWLLPLSLYNGINYSLAQFAASEKNTRRYFFLSSHKSMIVIPFPTIFTSNHDNEIAKWLEESVEQDYIVLDFGNVRHLNAKGVALIAETVKWAENLGKKLFIMNIHPDVRFLLKLNGFWNYFQILEVRNPQEIIYRMSEAGKGPLNYLEFYESIYQEKNEVILSFFGEFSIADDYDQIIQNLIPILYQKNCTINLNYCSFIDNKGIGFLLKLQHLQKANGLPFKIIGINPSVARQLKSAKVEHLLKAD